MAFADDLLEQAYHLVRKDGQNPKQASLRRAVSTAYYAPGNEVSWTELLSHKDDTML